MRQILESYHSPAAFKNSAILKLTEAFQRHNPRDHLITFKVESCKECINSTVHVKVPLEVKRFLKIADKRKDTKTGGMPPTASVPHPPVHQASGEDVIRWPARHPADVKSSFCYRKHFPRRLILLP